MRIELNKKQKEAFEYLTDEKTTSVGYGGGAGGGKSYLGVVWLFIMADCYPETRWFIGRKTLKNLKVTTLETFFKFMSFSGLPREYVNYNAQKSMLTFPNGSTILLLDLAHQPSDPLYTRFGGLELTGGFIDESNEVPEKAIQILSTRVGRQYNQKYSLKPKILETFNPDKGHVYKKFYRAQKDGTIEPWRKFIPALATDNPKLDKGYIEGLRKADEVTRERLLNGNFEYDDDPRTMFEERAIQDLFTTEIDPEGLKHLSVDVAGKGQDRTVAMAWQGKTLTECRVMEKNDATELIEMVREMAVRHKIGERHITFDADGIGFVMTHFRNAFEFRANAKPIKVQGKVPYFRNLKAQCYAKLAQMTNQNDLDLRKMPKRYVELLKEELRQMKQWHIDKDTPFEVIPKQEIKLNMGRSPDFADALMMSMVHHLQVRVRPKQFDLRKAGFLGV